jgi:hypothetical protein
MTKKPSTVSCMANNRLYRVGFAITLRFSRYLFASLSTSGKKMARRFCNNWTNNGRLIGSNCSWMAASYPPKKGERKKEKPRRKGIEGNDGIQWKQFAHWHPRHKRTPLRITLARETLESVRVPQKRPTEKSSPGIGG